MKPSSFHLALALLVVLSSRATFADDPKTVIPADNPIPYGAGWLKECQDRVAAVQGKPVDIMFIGDSLTQNFLEKPTAKWPLVGYDVWQSHYANRNVLNFGVGSDGTEHILWRLSHMNVQSLAPKVIVLLAGVNDMKYPTADIAAGTKAVLDKLKAMYPSAKIVLMAILPNSRNRQRTAEVNAITQTFADNQSIFWLDLTPFMKDFKGVGFDGVHLKPEGYETWASHLDPLIDQLLSGN